MIEHQSPLPLRRAVSLGRVFGTIAPLGRFTTGWSLHTWIAGKLLRYTFFLALRVGNLLLDILTASIALLRMIGMLIPLGHTSRSCRIRGREKSETRVSWRQIRFIHTLQRVEHRAAHDRRFNWRHYNRPHALIDMDGLLPSCLINIASLQQPVILLKCDNRSLQSSAVSTIDLDIALARG